MIFRAASRLPRRGPHDLEHPVERVEDQREPVQQMEGGPASRHRSSSSRRRTTSRRKSRKSASSVPHADAFRNPAGRALEPETGEVHRHRGLERGALREERDDPVHRRVAPDLEADLDVVGGEVAHVEESGERAVRHDLPEALDELRLVHAVRNRGDVERPDPAAGALVLEDPADPQRAPTAPVDFGDLLRRIEDLAAGREVRTREEARQLLVGALRVVEERDERIERLGGVVRRDRGRDADGDAGGAVDQQQREPGGRERPARCARRRRSGGRERCRRRDRPAGRRRPAGGGTRCSASPPAGRRRATRSCPSPPPARRRDANGCASRTSAS